MFYFLVSVVVDLLSMWLVGSKALTHVANPSHRKDAAASPATCIYSIHLLDPAILLFLLLFFSFLCTLHTYSPSHSFVRLADPVHAIPRLSTFTRLIFHHRVNILAVETFTYQYYGVGD